MKGLEVKKGDGKDKGKLFLVGRFAEVDDVKKENPDDILPNRFVMEILRETVEVQLEGENAPRPVRKVKLV